MSDAQLWQNRFVSTSIDTAIMNAAQGVAYNPGQLTGLLKGNAKAVEDLGDDGKPNGQFKVVITVPVIEPDGKTRAMKELPASDAVRSFLSLPENANLAINSVRDGSGHPAKQSQGVFDGKYVKAGDKVAFQNNIADIASGKIQVIE
jgi:hypothetical protein